MITLTNQEMLETNGGISIGLVTVLIGAIALVAGFIDGYLNPLKCRK